MKNKPKFGPQPAAVWRKLAHVCAKDSMNQIAARLEATGGNSLGARETAIIEKMLFASVIAAYHSVAGEAVQGVDVTGALHAGEEPD